MMISPEGYYKEYLKEKDEKQIITAIRGLKQEMGRLIPTAAISVQFFKRVQSKIHYAVSGKLSVSDIYGLHFER